MAIYDGYEPVIGLEVHAQLSTDSKLFCGCKNEYGADANTQTCPVCLGLPGALPVINKKAVEFAVRLTIAVGGIVNEQSLFARKNYFYPDLPKGFQISQYDKPFSTGGKIKYTNTHCNEIVCGVHRIHLEEDAGKSLHPEQGDEQSRIDFNRSGVPLLEIVSEPEIHSPEDAYQYLRKLKQLLQYLDICSGDMEKGHLRCDANISLRSEGKKDFGTRTELKNLNSFKMIEKALSFEIHRQIELLKAGKKVEQVTLHWDEKENKAVEMRTKEESDDYRYFNEPDLLPLTISNEWKNEIKRKLPELPDSKYQRFVSDYDLREYDAQILTESKELADYYEAVVKQYPDSRMVANWIQTELLGYLKEQRAEISSIIVLPQQFGGLLSQIKSGAISSKIGKEILREMLGTGKTAENIIKTKDLTQISDESLLTSIIEQVIVAHENQVRAYQSGKKELLRYFVGQVMKETDGRANPGMVNELLKRKLKE